MALIKSINFEGNQMILTLGVSKDEYDIISNEKDLLVLPTSSLDTELVTGTLGNSNRIMMPNKVLKKGEIKKLHKHVKSRIIKTKKGSYLIIQLEQSDHIPVFDTE